MQADKRPHANRPAPANKLNAEERQKILELCKQQEYASLPPGQIVPRLADQGEYIGSESSFYRVLRAAGLQQHRGRTRKPYKRKTPQGFCATGPNQVWSWDVTWLSTPIRGMYYYLYMIIDVYSRKVVGWEVHPAETGKLAGEMLLRAILAEKCVMNPPVLHADNGGPQRGFTLRAKMEALGVTASYSRARVSNDNPFSESLFRTLKYRPAYPEHGFSGIDESRQWVGEFVRWYNEVHFHSKLRYVAPAKRHSGLDHEILERRVAVYQQAQARHPERWSGSIRNWEPIGPVWLNPPHDMKDQFTSLSQAA